MLNSGETNVQISNALNIGKVTSTGTWIGGILGRAVPELTIIQNCYYNSENVNKSVGLGSTTGEATSTEINDNLITTLNEYVTNYNNTNKNNDDFIELKSWELSGGKVKFK